MRLLILFLLLFPLPAFAQSADAMAALQGRLVRAAADIRAVERHLQELEDYRDSLLVRRANLEKEYNERRKTMSGTLTALTRMGRTPREAALVRPGGPLQAARTSMLLSASIPAIATEAASYQSLLTELEKTRQTINDQTNEARKMRGELSGRHERLNALLNDRSSTVSFEEQERQVAALGRDARTLRDLLSALDGGGAAKLPDAVALVPDGEGQLPVSGIIRIKYGQKDDMGTKSSGLSIETLAGSIVVAPLGGIVRYAGPFKGYGNIVIIAHKGGYHSLVAGLDKINVSAGQTIVSGEPIAILDTNQTDRPRRTVYYELRYGGAPVDPSRKLPDLG